jgi:hypothetical protein
VASFGHLLWHVLLGLPPLSSKRCSGKLCLSYCRGMVSGSVSLAVAAVTLGIKLGSFW